MKEMLKVLWREGKLCRAEIQSYIKKRSQRIKKIIIIIKKRVIRALEK